MLDKSRQSRRRKNKRRSVGSTRCRRRRLWGPICRSLHSSVLTIIVVLIGYWFEVMVYVVLTITLLAVINPSARRSSPSSDADRLPVEEVEEFFPIEGGGL